MHSQNNISAKKTRNQISYRGTGNSDVRLCVCVSVFRRIIDFCEGDLEGASLLLSTGSLSHWF